ncbi:Origin recognition complex subunit 2 [Tulasnella sp. 424]|nr:Origin recognition complex subunit 2 [Tulasnella sp. 424]KAG8980402.1 Origin recognition complex subunit 2 [Tulasnella sp. 425]
METPTKKRINRELSALRGSDGFRAATKSRESIPNALLTSDDEWDDGAEGSKQMDVDDTPSRKRTRHVATTPSDGLASRSSMPNLASPTKRVSRPSSPTKASSGVATTPTNPRITRGVIFVTTNDPRLRRPKAAGTTPKSSPTKTKGTPSGGRVSPTKGKGKGKEKELFEDEDNEVPETPSRSRVGGKKVNFNEQRGRQASISSRSLGLDEESDDEFGPRRAGGEDEDEDDGEEERHTDEEGSSQEEEDDGLASPTKKSAATPRKGRKKKTYESLLHVPGFVSQTSFDAYFQQISIPARTSNNAFTALLPTLSADEYWELLESSLELQKHAAELSKLMESHVELFPRFAMELAAGFNLLFYGYGSKRNVLNRFARECLAKKGDVAVLNGFKPGVGVKELLDRIDALRGETEDAAASLIGRVSGQPATLALSGLDLQAQRIYKHYSRNAKRPLYIAVHSIDSPMLRTAKSKAILSLLASNPRIHLVGSVDHMNAPLIWSQNEAFGRGHEAEGLAARRHDAGAAEATSPSKSTRQKPKSPRKKSKAVVDDGGPQTHEDPAGGDRIPTERGFTWLWHDLTTYEHYDVELRFQGRDLTSPTVLTGSGKSKHVVSAAGGPAGVAGPLTEAGAKQVLSSVTERSRSIFALLSEQQIANIDAEADERIGAAAAKGESASPAKKTLNVTATQMSHYAIPYESLFVMAREKFIATSDQALRGLLQEFRDHGMVVTGVASSGGGEMIWIPLARNVLERLLQSSDEE